MPSQIDAVNGYLTEAMADKMELKNWAADLDYDPHQLP